MASAPNLSVEKDVEMDLNLGVGETRQEVEFSRAQPQQERESSLHFLRENSPVLAPRGVGASRPELLLALWIF